MTKSKKLKEALAKIEYYQDYSQQLNGYIEENEKKILELKSENRFLASQVIFSTWDKKEYKRLLSENKELNRRIKTLDLLLDIALGHPRIGGETK